MTFFLLFFSHRLKICDFPLFSLFHYISPYLAKIIIYPLLLQISPRFHKIDVFFYMLSVFFVSPLL